ncbi:MAG: hypothetical protein RIG61_11830 [Deltaproteobacteria bacterium]
MEIVIAWITIASLIMFVLGLIDPGTALFWIRGEKTRKRAAMLYGFIFFVMMAFGVVFFPRTNLESKLYTLLVFCVIAMGAGFVNPSLVMPWRRAATKRTVAFFYLPAVLLLVGALFYAGMSKPVDPRYDIPEYERSGAEEPGLIAFRAASVLRGENNLGLSRVREIDVTGAASGGYNVLVEYNMDDVMFARFFRLKAEADMTSIYKSLYSSGYDIKKVTVSAYFPVGPRREDNPPVAVWTTSLGKKKADKIDWDKSVYELEGKILPKAWKTEYVLPGYE